MEFNSKSHKKNRETLREIRSLAVDISEAAKEGGPIPAVIPENARKIQELVVDLLVEN